MEAFFDREVQRLNFTTQRMDDRVREKKALDTAKVEAVATVSMANTKYCSDTVELLYNDTLK